MTTGIFFLASASVAEIAPSLSGATTSASTPNVRTSPMMRICVLTSDSLGGPSHFSVTPSSLHAFSAPALTDIQKMWVRPLGMTAIVLGLAFLRVGGSFHSARCTWAMTACTASAVSSA